MAEKLPLNDSVMAPFQSLFCHGQSLGVTQVSEKFGFAKNQLVSGTSWRPGKLVSGTSLSWF
jgi:hypothetical protein